MKRKKRNRGRFPLELSVSFKRCHAFFMNNSEYYSLLKKMFLVTYLSTAFIFFASNKVAGQSIPNRNITKERISNNNSDLADKHSTILYGQISDEKGNPISDVSLKVGKNGTISDSNGCYSLKLPPKFRSIEVRCIGYKTQQLGRDILNKQGGKIHYDIILIPSETAISEVVITAKNESRRLKESAMPVSVISSKMLQGSCSSINEVISRTTGVTIRNTGGVGSPSRISVRGLEGKRMGIYIDEISAGFLHIQTIIIKCALQILTIESLEETMTVLERE